MQIKWQKSLFLVHFFAYLLHLATVASGELHPQGGVRRYKCVAKCKGESPHKNNFFEEKMCFCIKKVHICSI